MMAHVYLPLSARAVLVIGVTRELRCFYWHLATYKGVFRFSSEGWAVLSDGQCRQLACLYATPWLLVLTTQPDAQSLYIWRWGIPDYHFRLIYRHCCR
ncbi:hypothetical protein [Salinivibrio sharmensis]|uniref:hypothetical protein n=1 Tax=Salinivibrio sharmensis TaxID=390883 RepID=UPI00138FEF6C|nr:hypothetical protein [Salinivibrio sharmensis]